MDCLMYRDLLRDSMNAGCASEFMQAVHVDTLEAVLKV